MTLRAVHNKTLITKTRVGVAILVLFHLVGIIGLTSDQYTILFAQLTPLHLILSATILFYFHKTWSYSFFLFVFITFNVGFFVEVLGIQTGSIFGQYSYSSVLGPKVFDTPLIIGINWLMLVYATGIIGNYIGGRKFIKALIATILMVLLDYFIEPIAIKLNFWQWESNNVPVQNYIAWGLISFVLLYIFYLSPFKKYNPIALSFYIIQLLFFLTLNLIL